MGAPHQDNDETRIRKPSQAIPARFKASVVIVDGEGKGSEHRITKPQTVIGRDNTADLALNDGLVSRQHAAILYQDGNYTLKDLGSKNGTHVNGALTEQASLFHGDKFRIGDTTLEFILDDTDSGTVYEIE